MGNRILLVTATKVEATTVLDLFSEATSTEWQRMPFGDKTYYKLGKIGELEIFMVQSEKGVSGLGSSLQTAKNAISHLHPTAIVLTGIAFGTQRDDQKLGDILVSEQLMTYEIVKIDGKDVIDRGYKVPCSSFLLDKFRSGDLDWKGTKVHFGVMLTGEKLIASKAFRDQLIKRAPEAIGGEMEGGGLYSAAQEAKVDWIVVKGICDWATHKKNDEMQPVAAHNAVSFVVHVLKQMNFHKPKLHIQIIRSGEIKKINMELEGVELVTKLAALLKVDKSEIRLLQIVAGSIVFKLEMSEIAAHRLLELFLKKDFRLTALNWDSIVFQERDNNLIQKRRNEIARELGNSVVFDDVKNVVQISLNKIQATALENVSSFYLDRSSQIKQPFIRQLEKELINAMTTYFPSSASDIKQGSKNYFAILYFSQEVNEIEEISKQLRIMEEQKPDYLSDQLRQLVKEQVVDAEKHTKKTLELINTALSSSYHPLGKSIQNASRKVLKYIEAVHVAIAQNQIDSIWNSLIGLRLEVEIYHTSLKELNAYLQESLTT